VGVAYGSFDVHKPPDLEETMDAAFFKTVGLAVLAIFGIGAGCFLKEDVDLRARGGLTISQAIMQPGCQ